MMGSDKRIFYDIESLVDEIAMSCGPEKKIVLANGCFDILHVGHIRYLSEAAEHGDILVVAINDDESTRRLKGEGRPVIPGEERAEILTAISCVDYVILFSEGTVDSIIRKLRPSVHAKGTDYTAESVPEAGTALETGCRTVITGDKKDHSSRDIIKKMREE